MFYLYDEIYWYRSININSYEMMVTYVYFVGSQQSNISVDQLRTLLKNSTEFRHFVIAICNDFYKHNKYNYDFIFSQNESGVILTIIQVDHNKISRLFSEGTHENKQNYLFDYENWRHKIIE